MHFTFKNSCQRTLLFSHCILIQVTFFLWPFALLFLMRINQIRNILSQAKYKFSWCTEKLLKSCSDIKINLISEDPRVYILSLHSFQRMWQWPATVSLVDLLDYLLAVYISELFRNNTSRCLQFLCTNSNTVVLFISQIFHFSLVSFVPLGIFKTCWKCMTTSRITSNEINKNFLKILEKIKNIFCSVLHIYFHSWNE